MTTQKEIGIVIKQQRKAKGLTQQQLADLTSDTRQTINSLEAGNRNITIERLNSILIALDLNIYIQ